MSGIHLSALRELWIHTGTACNLSCPFCHEGSQPGDRRLEALTLAELQPHLDAAADAGVERFAFTGGEPLILKDIVTILRHALALRPCLLLTNGTAPLIRRPHHLQQLRDLAYPLTFRVSIDYPDEARHDAARGLRNFRKALQGLKLLADAGFEVGITRQQDAGEDSAAIAARFVSIVEATSMAWVISASGEPNSPRSAALARRRICSTVSPSSSLSTSSSNRFAFSAICFMMRSRFIVDWNTRSTPAISAARRPTRCT